MQQKMSVLWRQLAAPGALGCALLLSTSRLTAATTPACPTCILGYPYNSSNPRTSVTFNESEILRAFSTNVTGRGDTIRAWYNDEHALTLGVRQVIVTTANGRTTNNYPVTPLSANPGSALRPSIGATDASGDRAGTDTADRPMFPALYITDITANLDNKAGDWQFGGTPIPPHAIFGSWKAAVRTVDKTKSPPLVTVTPDPDPAANHWNLAGGDPAPAGTKDEGYGAEVRWNVDDLGLLHGHLYRLYFMFHDGDQNKSGGDVGHACLNVIVADRAPVAVNDAYMVNEGAKLSIAPPGVLANDTDLDTDPLSAILVNGPLHGVVSLSADGGFTYAPAPNYNGPDSFTYKASDGQAQSGVATVSITVVPVNSPPSFNKGPDQLVNENAPAQSITNWATNISAGPPNETGQTLTFIVANDTNALFSVQPAISPNGTLTYTPAPNAYGVAHVTVVLKDNGGTANGGVDASAPQTFIIIVNSPPLVSIVQPTNNTIFIAPTSISVIADAHDLDGTISQVSLYQRTNLLLRSNAGPYLTIWPNVPAGSYQFTAQAIDNYGAKGTSSPVNITVLAGPPLQILQAPRFNPQTGLFEERVRILNPTPLDLAGARILITNLPTGVQVFNATGKTNGLAYVQTILPIPAGGSSDLTIEYYVPNFQVPNPSLSSETISPPLGSASTPSVSPVPITRQLHLATGEFLLEFSSLASRTYFVEYTDDLKAWKTAWPSIVGTGNRIQWLDNGAPRTESTPMGQHCRFYRVMVAP